MENKKVIDIGYGDLDIYVDGELVLHIGQVSDDEVINLFLYPEGCDLVESLMHQEDSSSKCTHEVLKKRSTISLESKEVKR